MYDTAALLRAMLFEAYGAVLIEAYIAGREFTVLVCADGPDAAPACAPAAGISLPDSEHFKTYDLKVRQFHPECNIPCADQNSPNAYKPP